MNALRMIAFVAAVALPGIVSPSLADETSQATPQEVIAKVHQAVRMLEDKGKAGFAEFNNPHGPWAWKDSYVFVYNCQKNEMVAHPIRPDLVGRPLMQIRDANNKPIFKELCAAGNKPNGGWVEYVWPKPGEGGVSRKISYAHSADVSFEFGVQVAAGIYNDEVSVEELTKILNEMMDPTSYKAL